MILAQLFPHERFSPPASEQTIKTAEEMLGVRLPEQLRKLYEQCDGFREGRGNAKYLLSLLEEDSIGSLVTVTRHMWTEYTVPNFKPFVFFGSSNGDETWGINPEAAGQVIAYHYQMGDQYEVVDSEIVQVWQADYAKYER
jgi:hypothetical protein